MGHFYLFKNDRDLHATGREGRDVGPLEARAPHDAGLCVKEGAMEKFCQRAAPAPFKTGWFFDGGSRTALFLKMFFSFRKLQHISSRILPNQILAELSRGSRAVIMDRFLESIPMQGRGAAQVWLDYPDGDFRITASRDVRAGEELFERDPEFGPPPS